MRRGYRAVQRKSCRNTKELRLAGNAVGMLKAMPAIDGQKLCRIHEALSCCFATAKAPVMCSLRALLADCLVRLPPLITRTQGPTVQISPSGPYVSASRYPWHLSWFSRFTAWKQFARDCGLRQPLHSGARRSQGVGPCEGFSGEMALPDGCGQPVRKMTNSTRLVIATVHCFLRMVFSSSAQAELCIQMPPCARKTETYA